MSHRSWLSVALAVGVLSACGGGPTSPAPPPPPPPPAPTGCAVTSVGLTPLIDLLTGTYQGQAGGLYPGAVNTRPAGHDASGLAIARSVGPLGSAGQANSNGRYVLVSIGMSNTTQEFSVFKPLADTNSLKDPRLTIVDGAQSSMTASDWANAACPCWGILAQRLNQAGVTANQVVIAWIKLSEANPTGGWPGDLQNLKNNIILVIRLLKQRLPNLRLAYLSSRIYAGYATIRLNPEPFSYQTGFAVRWVIEDQLAGVAELNFDPQRGTVLAPWLSWGPYLWADGLRPRSDGLTWACSDLGDDGTHPSPTGRRKVADMLLGFFRTDATAREWFLANP